MTVVPEGPKRGWSPVPEIQNPKPWYRHFWPWVLIGLPLAAVLAGVATLFIAMDDPDSLVVGDYYKQGLAINRTLAREKAARRLGLTGRMRIDTVTGAVTVSLSGNEPVASEAMRLNLLHATRDKHDVQMKLNSLGGGRYGGVLEEPLSLGAWTVNMEPPDESWRISARTYLTADTPSEITADLAP